MDMRPGVTDISQRILQIHHYSLAICVVMGVLVFGTMFYSMYAHRRSKHPKPADFHESMLAEIVWTAVPFLILIGLAIPATSALREIEDNSNADLTVLITGSQWKWHYQYLDADFGYYSNMSTPTEQINNLETKSKNYILEVDNALVLPTSKKVRFLTTSDDVIHSWWVPDFAVKQDAIPGYINEAWTRIEVPGLFRGQCAELCGKDHAYMPIEVEVLPEEEFDQWILDQLLAIELASGQAVADRAKTWTLAELMDIGQTVFIDNCATCHEADGSGQGSTYPALAGGEIPTGDMSTHIERVMDGAVDTEMQAWAPQLSDLELASVITYERNAFGNDLGDIVQPLTIFESR
ncbi:MAG TPA: cytochrome c oxidase subunit II [Gammaproteobacteria bacterium]|nr:cytochrome c oxidase subunit II [Gammaproteobacteria bacterium]|tara:strand:+ start:921 stop:1970 length:1050 start_codon:yes stop_codon:yes gene_type:complete